jgi:hypothetical protein
MSRRWYRHESNVVFFGWDPADQAFYVNLVDLCEECLGTGEIDFTEEVCPACGGEGIQLASMRPSDRVKGLTLDQLEAEFDRRRLPFPQLIRADLEEDQRANAATLLHEYDLTA